MALYSKLFGERVEVEYRAGDVLLSAIGKLAADSGKSIFLEEHSEQNGQAKTFRWEIPYPCILSVERSYAPEPSAAQRTAENERAAAEQTDSRAAVLKRAPHTV